MLISENHIEIETTAEDIEVQKKALLLARMYDHYVGAIDNGTQYRAAKEYNARILVDLADMGCSTVTWKDHTPMMSSETEDLVFDLTK